MNDIKKLLPKLDYDKVAEKMTEALTDPDVQTYDMFENIVNAYADGNDDFRKGMEEMFEILTWTSLKLFVEQVEAECMQKEEE